MIRKSTSSPWKNSADETTAEYYVLGGGNVGVSLANYLRHQGRSVLLVDESHESSDAPGRRGDPTDVGTLEDVGLSDDSTVVVATPSDTRNMLIAQLANARFDASRVIVLGNDPETLDAFEAAGHEPICATTALVETLGDSL